MTRVRSTLLHEFQYACNLAVNVMPCVFLLWLFPYFRSIHQVLTGTSLISMADQAAPCKHIETCNMILAQGVIRNLR